MARFGFCAGGYKSQSLAADAQRCVNFYPETDESGTGKSQVDLYPTPGSAIFAALAGLSVRGFVQITEQGINTGRCFAVSGQYFYELFSNGTTQIRNPLNPFPTTGIVSMASSPTQILIICGLQPFCYNLTTNVFQPLQTYNDTGGQISAPYAIAAPGSAYAVSDVVNVPAGVGGQFTVTAVSPPVTVTSGLISGCVLSVYDAGHLAQLSVGQLEAQSTIVNIPATAPLPSTYMAGPFGSPITNYLFYNVPTGFYWSIVPSPTTIGDCYVGSIQAEIDPVTLQVVLFGNLQPPYGTSGVTIPGGAVTAVNLTAPGSQYTPGNNVPVTGGTGSGLQLNFSTTNVSAGSGMIANPILCAFSDGYFIVLQQNSQQIQVSQLEDASTWDPTQVAQISVFVDNVVSMLVAYRQLWLWGSRQAQVYYDSGNTFPFDPIPGAFIEQGSGAMLAPVRLDNSVMWIGQDERGCAIAWRANGYTPVRISNHAIEYEWQGYATVSDAIGYAWQYSGHSFWQIYFPTAGKTWCYDPATNQWHERTSWNATTSAFGAHCSQCHVFAFGTHLIGDWATGNVYQENENLVDDHGYPIQRIRAAPYIFREAKWIYHSQLQLDVEVGLGPQPPLVDGNNNPRQPQLFLDWSDDQGKTWSNGRWLDCGFSGQFRTRVIARRLGRSRGRIYRVTVTDPIQWRFVDAYLEAEPGFQPAERLAAQIGKLG